MATVCAVLLHLWCMWWHFWPSGELYNVGAVRTPDRPRLPCLSCCYSVSYRCTVSFIWPEHHDNRFSGKVLSRQDQGCIPLSWKQNKISTKSSSTPVCCDNRNNWNYRDYVFCDECRCYRCWLCRLSFNQAPLVTWFIKLLIIWQPYSPLHFIEFCFSQIFS